MSLTALEFDLLLHLASHPGRVFTRDQLMEQVWNSPFFTDTSTVTVHVRRLRGKIEPDPGRPRYIQTARGRRLPLLQDIAPSATEVGR